MDIGPSQPQPAREQRSAEHATRWKWRPLGRRSQRLRSYRTRFTSRDPDARLHRLLRASQQRVQEHVGAPLDGPRDRSSRRCGGSCRPTDGMKIIPASVTAARFCASWPAAEYIRCVVRPSFAQTASIAAWTFGEQGAGTVADVGRTSTRSCALLRHALGDVPALVPQALEHGRDRGRASRGPAPCARGRCSTRRDGRTRRRCSSR